MVIAGQVFVYDELPKVESTTELLVSRAEAPLARRTLRTAGDGRVLMAHFEQDTDGMINISGRWWSFPGAHIETDSWEVECRGYGKLYLHDGVGNVVKGRELSEAEIEQMFRETLLSDVLELAAARLRSGEGWDEGTTTDVLNEIEHVTGGRRQPDRVLESTE